MTQKHLSSIHNALVTLTDELKVLDNKIKAYQVEYDLDRETAKIPALSSKELVKYEY